MNSIGLPISNKENERRRAMVPSDIQYLKHPEMVYFESGYGDVLGFTDKDYVRQGIRVGTRSEVLSKDIICDPKIGDTEYLEQQNGLFLAGCMQFRKGILQIRSLHII